MIKNESNEFGLILILVTKNFDLSNHIFSKEITKDPYFFEKSEVNELLLENERFRGFGFF